MSTFALDDSRFQQIEATLLNRDYSGNGSKYNLMLHLSGRDWDRLGVSYHFKPYRTNKNNKEYYGIHRLVGVWRAKNNRAARARYSHHEVIKTDKYDSLDLVKSDIMTPIELYKCLQSLKYNLDDYQCPVLNKVMSELTVGIIERLPEYDKAIYG